MLERPEWNKMGPKSWRMGFSRVISLDRIFFQSAKVLLSVVD
jgi:hypothetical protein